MKAKFVLVIGEKSITKPEWIDAENLPFQTSDEALDWATSSEELPDIHGFEWFILGLESASVRKFQVKERWKGNFDHNNEIDTWIPLSRATDKALATLQSNIAMEVVKCREALQSASQTLEAAE